MKAILKKAVFYLEKDGIERIVTWNYIGEQVINSRPYSRVYEVRSSHNPGHYYETAAIPNKTNSIRYAER